MTKEQMISAMWQKVFPIVCEKYKVPSDTMDENAYWFAPKMTTGYPKDSLVAACMKYMEHLNDEVAPASEKQMNYIMSLAAEDEKRLFRDITLTKTAASRVIDLLKQEENMIYGKSGSAEDFEEIANELEKIARLNGADLSQKDQKQAERNFVNSVTDALMQAMKTGEKPYKSIVDIRKAARESGMQIEDGKDDIKLQELVEDALVKVARDIMEEARIPGQRDIHKFRKETFEKIKLLYNLQPTISMRSSNRVALQQYSTPLPMAFCADMFANGRIMRMFYSAFEPTAGNGMLVFGIPSNRVHVNEIDENRLENLRGQGFKQVTSQDATQPFTDEQYYDAIITNPPFGETAAKDYDGYKISGLAQQIALNALDRMRDNGRAAIIIGGEQKFASNGAIQNDKPFLAYLYDHYNVKGVIDMDGSLYAKQGTTFPTRMILIDGRRTEEERAKSNVYPPVQKNWIPKADSFDKLYDTVNNIINSNEKTNGNIVLREGQLDVPVSDNTPGQIDERGHQRESKKGDRPVERVRGGLAPSNGPLLVQQDGNGESDGGRGRTGGRGDNREGDRRDDGRMGSGEEQPSSLPPTGSGQERRTDTSGRGNAGVPGEQPGHMDSTVHTGRGTGTGNGSVLKEEKKRDLTTDKLPYRSHNSSMSLESVAPAAMVEAMDATLKKIEEKEGNIDEFVTRELGYDSTDEMHKALAAEQVDSVAMAIYNMKNGDGMVIGDQTGVGKGRQMASLIRWAVRQGKKPVFITKDANLFSDMYRDLADIGSGNLRPFIFNASNGKNPGVMTDENGKVVYSALTENQQKKIFQSGVLPSEYDYAILSYSQVSTGDSESKSLASKIGAKKKQSTTSKPRSDAKAVFLRKLAKDNYILMDESQGAAGKSNTGAYMQTIVKDAKAVVFASATFAKTPETMPLYALRTAMSKANVEVEKLLDIIKKGGVTLQEIMSRALTTAGQMVRRERDMTDVVTDWKTISDPATVKKARDNYDKTIRAFNGIIEFQKKYVGSKLEQMSKDLASVASSATKKKGTNKMGVDNPPFVSKTFNYTSQLMLALKVDAIVDEVAKEIEAGRHPVIALDNTMESAIEGYSAGDTVTDVTFAAPLLKGLDKVMEYTVKSPMGDVNQKLTPESLGAEGAAAYYELENMIRESTGDVFVSPLDAITEKLQERGYTVGELTGRKDRLVRQPDGTYKVQSRGKVDKKGIARDFNNGKIDVVILNKSAATGISLHSSKRFKDQRQRTMIVAQALKDINDYMQMMGRIDRTGQVHRGYYINLGLPVPAENRLMMMLSTKLKSLNANTTTSQSNKDNDVKTLDILNRYGGQVILEYLKDNPDIYPKLQDPFKIGDDLKKLDKVKIDDETASKVTGRVALLDTDEQEAFYTDVAQRYKDLIDYLDSTNSNELKIQVLPLRAKTLSKRVSSKGVDPNGDNPFAQNAYVEQVEVDVLRKPMKATEIEATKKRLLGDFKSPLEFMSSIRERIDAQKKEREAKENARYEKEKTESQEKMQKNIEKIDASTKLTPEQKRDTIDKFIKELRKAIVDKHDKNINNIQNESDALLTRFYTFDIGSTYLVPTNVYDLMFDDSSPAIFCGFKISKDKLTPSTSIGIFATLDGRRRVEVKMSDSAAINNIKKHTNDNYYEATQTNLSNWDSKIPNQTRENRYILTGNILQAINDSMTTEGSFPGQIVTYSDIDGNTHDGILMPANWQPSMMASAGSPISSKLEDIKRGETITSSDGKIKIETKTRNWGEPKYLVHVPKSKQKSGKIYQNDEIAKLVDGVFYQKNNKFVGEVYESNLPKMLDVLSKMGIRVADESSSADNTNRLAYSNSTNNVNNSRIIPEDVEKSVSLQIENEFDSAIENATKGLSEKDKQYVTSKLLADMNSFAHMKQWELEEEYRYYKQLLEQNERRNQRDLQIQRPTGRKADSGISEAQNLTLLACIERERSYRERRAVRLSESLGLTAGEPITIDKLDKIYKQINKDSRLNEIFDKTISIAKRLGSSIEVANEDASGKGNFGESGTKRDLHYYIEAFCRTASSEQELPTVILHELIHQATTGAISIVKKGKAEGILTKQQIDAVNTIFDIYKKALDNKTLFSENDRGLLNEYEFAAQMADQRQRRALQGFDREDLSILDRIIRAAKQLKSQGDTSLWDRIKKAIKTLLNIPDALNKMDEAIDTLLDTFNENVNDILMNDIDQSDWGYTSTQLFDKYPTWLSGQTTNTGQHTTQITSTVNTYKKIGDWMKSQGMDGASVLDASSGLGKGTEALRDMGFNVEDVEPYPSENRTAPTYLKYEDIKGKYDVVISNAVLNVIPDDWRADVLKNMADKVKPGGKMIINVRDAKEMERQKQKIELDSPSEILVTDKAGNIRAYQKGFTQKELSDWIQSELGEGWTVETAKPANSGISGRAVVVTRNTDAPLAYRRIENQFGSPRARRVSDENQSQMRAHAEAIAEKLNTKLTFTTSDKLEDEKKTAKGWYNKKTGEVVIVLDNNKDNFDIEQTVIHEVVGHKGLRALLGAKGLYRLLDSIYANMDNETKEAIDEATRRNGWRQYTAIEEYLAEQAEKTVWDSKSASLWQNVKHYLTEALRTLGFMIRPNLKDARYWLWLSKNNLKRGNVMSEIKRLALLNKIERMGVPKIADANAELELLPDELYRAGKYVDTVAFDAIEQRLKTNSFYWKEAYFDYMESYKVFQTELEKGLKNGLMDNMNAYLGENHLSSSIAQQQEDFLSQEVKVLEDKINELKAEFGEGAEGIDNLENYLMMKSGLERNRVIFMRDWFNSELKRTINSSSELSPEAEYIYEKMEQYIWQDFDDGNITEEQRDKQLKQALQDAHAQYLDKAMNDFNRLRNYVYSEYENQRMTLKDAYRQIDDLINSYTDFDPNKNDKSGLTALTQYFKSGKYEDEAIINEVQGEDRKIKMQKANELMDAVQKVTQFALDQDYKNGLVTKEAYNRAKSMFRYYIPMRGFKQDTMEDLYNYMTDTKGIGANSLIHAKGRKSSAESPLATAANMAMSAIDRGLKNQNKQRAYRLVLQWQKYNPNAKPPATVVDLWKVKDATGDWNIKTPNITDDMSAEDIRDEIERFNSEMKQLEKQGVAKRETSPASFPANFTSKTHQREHMVPLMMNGKGKVIIFNGNPRPAQALRGELSSSLSNETSVAGKAIGKINRVMASAFTSYNPSFMASNLFRDTGFANNNIRTKESLEYWKKFTKNQGLLMTKDIGRYVMLQKNYQKGIPPRNEMEQYFYEFMKYGGKTGFVNQHDIAKLERMLIKNNTSWNAIESGANIIVKAGDIIKMANDRVENVNRFAAYMTSRQVGRSVMRSISDAKDVSVNFNRKGARGNTASGTNVTANMKFAGYTAAFAGGAYLFFNAGLQSMVILGRNAKKHPIRTLSYTVGIPMIFGALIIPMFNRIVAEAFGDGDDPYANLPEWTRRNNICLYVGHGSFIKIPLPIEIRAFYGIGDIAAGYLVDENLKSSKGIGIDILSQVSQILPVDFMGEGGGLAAALTPDALKPAVQLMTNTDWTGKPIWKEKNWDKYAPEYTKAFSGEYEVLVNMSKFINAVSGDSYSIWKFGKDLFNGDKDKIEMKLNTQIKGSLDKIEVHGVNLNNPAVWHAIIGGFGGGAAKTVLETMQLGRRIVTNDWEDFSTKELPIVKALVDTPTEKTQYYRVLNKFYNYRNEIEEFDNNMKKWKVSLDPMEHSKYLVHTNTDKPTPEIIRSDMMRQYKIVERQINDALKNPKLPEEMQKTLKEQLTRTKIELVKMLDNVE
ncbi:MAG: LPD38 domain-containing protein [Prevotella sp.]